MKSVHRYLYSQNFVVLHFPMSLCIQYSWYYQMMDSSHYHLLLSLYNNMFYHPLQLHLYNLYQPHYLTKLSSSCLTVFYILYIILLLLLLPMKFVHHYLYSRNLLALHYSVSLHTQYFYYHQMMGSLHYHLLLLPYNSMSLYLSLSCPYNWFPLHY